MAAHNGHSANVALTLIVGGVPLALSHVGAGEIIIKDECGSYPACDAKLMIRVDDSKKSRKIFLPHGIPGPRQPVMFI